MIYLESLSKLRKLSSEFIKGHLSLIFYESFKEGIVPEKLKSAIVHPIHKGNSSIICANCRFILILPILSKILKKMVHKRLINCLDMYELLFKHQHSFQKGKFTEHAKLDLHKNMVEAIEKKKQKAYAIFLYIAKAFDTVNHKILFKKPEYYGVRGFPLTWFQSYLHNRQ